MNFFDENEDGEVTELGPAGQAGETSTSSQELRTPDSSSFKNAPLQILSWEVLCGNSFGTGLIGNVLGGPGIIWQPWTTRGGGQMVFRELRISYIGKPNCACRYGYKGKWWRTTMPF